MNHTLTDEEYEIFREAKKIKQQKDMEVKLNMFVVLSAFMIGLIIGSFIVFKLMGGVL
jgi:hypothetical protein